MSVQGCGSHRLNPVGGSPGVPERTRGAGFRLRKAGQKLLKDGGAMCGDRLRRLVDFGSGRFDDASCLDAAGADDHLSHPAVSKCADPLKIRIESSLGHIVRVADVASHHGFFPTDFTYFRHIHPTG